MVLRFHVPADTTSGAMAILTTISVRLIKGHIKRNHKTLTTDSVTAGEQLHVGLTAGGDYVTPNGINANNQRLPVCADPN